MDSTQWTVPPGDEFGADPGREPDVVTYHFPVQLEVVGELDHHELRRVARYVFDELDASLRNAH